MKNLPKDTTECFPHCDVCGQINPGDPRINDYWRQRQGATCPTCGLKVNWKPLVDNEERVATNEPPAHFSLSHTGAIIEVIRPDNTIIALMGSEDHENATRLCILLNIAFEEGKRHTENDNRRTAE